jgi:pyruvate dehydrogenase E1 component alpha subunit
LIENSIATADELDAIYAAVEVEVEEAFEFSQSSPYPDPSDPYKDLYTEPFEVYA